MTKKCIYCSADVEDTCVIDFCEKCGVGVFGRKMFDAIVQNMERARANGDLTHSQSDSFQNSTNLKDFK
ncbi:hypothetical protein J4225_01950 [Candidatus Pacearchaeota archaeon]|nr:hypothetical protein [Candidatus Pacearchaeota archaeon]